MGTRHNQTVIDKEGNLKLSQYGQWDGYPSGQGVEILKYLMTGNLKEYQNNLNSIREITKEEIETIGKNPNWSIEYPYLSRDCGSKIHKMIENGEVKFVQLDSEENAKKYCEGFFTIDFQKNIFKTEFYDLKCTMKLDSLISIEAYLKNFEDEEE